MKLIILTPEKTILDIEVTQVTVPTSAGQITILPHHAHLLSTLSLGHISYKTSDHKNEAFTTIESGIITTDGTDVKILADTAIHSADEEEMISSLRAKAQEIMKNAPKNQNLERLKSQIRIAELHLLSKKKKRV